MGHPIQRFGAWLGIFALLMLFAGPLLTQAQNLGLSATLAQLQNEMSCHHDGSSGVPAEHASQTHAVECGYCQLAVHFAALPALAPGLPAPLVAAAPGLHIVDIVGPRTAWRQPSPRAPPGSIQS